MTADSHQMSNSFSHLPVFRKTMVSTGIALLAMAAGLLAAWLGGVEAIEQLLNGPENGLRNIARVAVSGCVLAAIGYWEQ